MNLFYLPEELFSLGHENMISLGGSTLNEIFEGNWWTLDRLSGGFLTVTWLFGLVITFTDVLLLVKAETE